MMSGKESTLGPRIRMKQKGEEYTSLDLRERERERDSDILWCRLTEHVQKTERSLSLSVRN